MPGKQGIDGTPLPGGLVTTAVILEKHELRLGKHLLLDVCGRLNVVAYSNSNRFLAVSKRWGNTIFLCEAMEHLLLGNGKSNAIL